MRNPLEVLGFLAAAGLAAPAGAQPPPGTDPTSPVSQWFESLVRADGIPCCSVSDCRPVLPGQLRTRGDQLEWRLPSGDYEPVSESKLVWREDNPLGVTVVCAIGVNLYCVVPYGGG